MNKYFFSLSWLILILSTSCAPKQQDILAINVLLTVPKDVYNQAVDLNQMILVDHPDNFTLDKNHIPHITMLQCYVLESDLPQIEKALDGLYKTVENETFVVEDLQYAKSKSESFASMGLEKSKTLMNLHAQVIAIVEPYINKIGTHDAYVPNTDGTAIDQFTIDYVPKFVSHHSYENYNPHISLGVASNSLLDEIADHILKPMQFKATSISIYQLGAFGTAQKLLWKSE